MLEGILLTWVTVTNPRGERTASAMENQLTSLERKIDDLLASVDPKDTNEQTLKKGEATEKNGPA